MSDVSFIESEGLTGLDNGRVRVEVPGETGTLDIADVGSGSMHVSAAATSVQLTGGPVLTSRGAAFRVEGTAQVADHLGNGIELMLVSTGEPRLRLRVTVYEEHPFVVLQSEFINTERSPARVQALHVLDGGTLSLGGAAAGWRIYKEGWQNWTPAMMLPVAGEDLTWSPPVIGPTTQPPRRDGLFVAETMATIKDSVSGTGLIAGFVSTAEQFSQIWLDRDRTAITAVSYADGVEVPADGTLRSERLLIRFGNQPLLAMQEYGEALAREMAAVPWPEPVSGWCSWYFYWQGVSEEAVLANMEFLRWHRDELPVDYVQIDDGYQSGIGDWLTPNAKFPRGMRWLADQIHDRGYRAGIWLAPFMIGADSQLWKEHPEWAVQYAPGRPYIAMVNWAQECYAMDLSRPDVLEWVEKVFRTVFDDWGYDYIKIDFLYAGAVDGVRYDGNMTRAQVYRRAIELIRRIAGDRFILGCGHPIAPSIGLMNGSRIGPDVAPFWYPAEQPREEGRNGLSTVSTVNAIRNILGRFWMHNRLWVNDPDCVLARDSETALGLDEVRTLATVIALSGGMVLDSDNLTRLSDERRAIVSLLLPPYGRSAVPLDLFESDMPQLFELDCGTHRMLGVFNWADGPADVSAPLPEPEVHVFDVWQREYLGSHNGTVSFTLPAHACRLLALRRTEDRPQAVGTSFHLLQGVVEIEREEWDGKTLRVSLRPVATRRGKVFVHMPDRWRTPSVQGADARIGHSSGGILSVELDVNEPCEIALTFAER